MNLLKKNENKYDEFKMENSEKKIAIIYGNCHTTAIRQFLENDDLFCAKYAIYPIKAIQEVNNPEYFKGAVFKNCDLFIHQSIQKNNRYGEEYSSEHVMKNLKKDCNVIAIPNIYHLPLCYFPQYREGRELKNIYSKTIFFRDNIIDEGVKSGFSIKTIVEDYSRQGRYSYKQIKELYDRYIERVTMREKEWTIKIAAFLQENKNNVLFYDPNHPTNIVIQYICKGILNELGYKINYDFNMNGVEILDEYHMPLCRDVTDYFNINYVLENETFRKSGNKIIRGPMRIEDYVKQYISLLWQDKSFNRRIRTSAQGRYLLYQCINMKRRTGGLKYNDL